MNRRFGSNLLAVAYREFSAIRRDRPLLAMLSVQPVMMVLLFGFVLSNEPRDVPWGVLDRSSTPLSRRIAAEIEATGYFRRPLQVASYEEARALLRSGRVLAVVVLPEGLSRDLRRGHPQVQILLDGSEPLSAARVAAYAGAVVRQFEGERGEGRLRVFAAADSSAGRFQLRTRFRFNPTLRDREFFLAALAGMLLTNLCFSATSLGFAAERENGTYEQMLSLPTTGIELALGKVLPYVAISYGVLALAVVVPGILFGLWPRGSLVALAVVTAPFLVASLAIGLLISTFVRSSAQAVFLTVFFILPSFVLSGVLLPYRLMPPGIREVGVIVPLRWYQISLRRILQRGAGLAEVAEPFVALTLLAALWLALVRRRVRPRLG
jgi:ABC-2 type transport system permease protein